MGRGIDGSRLDGSVGCGRATRHPPTSAPPRSPLQGPWACLAVDSLPKYYPLMKPQVKIRRSMAVVAVIGLLLGGETMRRRRVFCLKKAVAWERLEDWALRSVERFESRAKEHRAWGQEFERKSRLDYSDAIPESSIWRIEYPATAVKEFSDAGAHDRRAKRERISAEYYRSIRVKYLRSARYPWLSVGPLPVEPPGAWHDDD